MSSKLISDLKSLLDGYSEKSLSRSRGKTSMNPIYLPDKKCPAAMSTCEGDACPPEELTMDPPIYTADSKRCYADVNIRHAKKLSKEDKDTAVKGIRALVVEVAKLRDLNAEMDKALGRQDLMSDIKDDLLSIPDEASGDPRKADADAIKRDIETGNISDYVSDDTKSEAARKAAAVFEQPPLNADDYSSGLAGGYDSDSSDYSTY